MSVVLGHWSFVTCRATAVPSFRPACRRPACGRQGRFQVPSFNRGSFVIRHLALLARPSRLPLACPPSASGVYPPWRAASALRLLPPAIAAATARGRQVEDLAWAGRPAKLRWPCLLPVPRSRFPGPRSPFPVPRSRFPGLPARLKGGFPIPDVAFSQQVFHNGVCASVHVKSHRKPSNSSQNRSKRRRFPSKSDQKRAHFVMPILTFWVVTPSGASARAVLGSLKGQKPVFRGSKMPCGKVIHKMWKTLAAPGPRKRPPARGSAAAPNRNPAPSCQVSV